MEAVHRLHASLKVLPLPELDQVANVRADLDNPHPARLEAVLVVQRDDVVLGVRHELPVAPWDRLVGRKFVEQGSPPLRITGGGVPAYFNVAMRRPSCRRGLRVPMELARLP